MQEDESVSTALTRLGPNIALLRRMVKGLETMLHKAETLEDEATQRALPFIGLVWLYSKAMGDVLNATRHDGKMAWNSPALAALCRPLLDAFLSLVYFAIEKPDAEESEFRLLLLSRHDKYKHWDLLRRADQRNAVIVAEAATAQAEWDAVNRALLAHPYFAKIEPGLAKKVASDGDRYIVEPAQDIWERAGLDADLYGVTFRYLSQYAHATPYAISQLKDHRADEEAGAARMMIPIGLANTLVTETLHYCADLHPDLDALVGSSAKEFIKSRVKKGHGSTSSDRQG